MKTAEGLIVEIDGPERQPPSLFGVGDYEWFVVEGLSDPRPAGMPGYDVGTGETVDQTLWSATLRPLTDEKASSVDQEILADPYTAAVHIDQVEPSQQLAIRVPLGPEPSVVVGELLIDADGSVELLSPCGPEGRLVAATDEWLARTAAARKQTPADLVIDLAEDQSLAEQLWVPEQPTTTPPDEPTSTTSPVAPPPGARLVRVTVTVPDTWLSEDGPGNGYSLCARTAGVIGTCAIISAAVGPAPDLFVLAGTDQPIEIIVVEGMDSDAVVSVAGAIAPDDVKGDAVATTLRGDPEAPTLDTSP